MSTEPGQLQLTSVGEADQDCAKAVRHGLHVTFQMAEIAVSWQMFQEILMLLRPAAIAVRNRMSSRIPPMRLLFDGGGRGTNSATALN